jgi:hypothetical protein
VADRDGAPSKRRVVALLNRRIERVHVDVNDLAHRHAPTISGVEQKENSGPADRLEFECCLQWWGIADRKIS